MPQEMNDSKTGAALKDALLAKGSRRAKEPSMKDIDLGDDPDFVNSEVYAAGDSEIDRQFEGNYSDRDESDMGLHGIEADPQNLHPNENRFLDNGDVDNIRTTADLAEVGAINGKEGDEGRFASGRYQRSADKWHEDEYEVDRTGRH